MTSRVKDPPHWSEDQSYEDYKKDIEIWQLLKSATPLEEGPLLLRVLTGKAKAAAKELTVAQIGSADGLKLILEKLDKLYLADKNRRIYATLEAFEKFKRPSNMNMSNFVFEFETLHAKVKAYNCIYPDGVLAYKILQAANLNPEHQRMCKATITTGNWTYEAVKDQLVKVASDLLPNDDSYEKPIKQETTYYSRKDYDRRSRSETSDEYSDYGDDDSSENEKYDKRKSKNSNHEVYYGSGKFRGGNNNERYRPGYHKGRQFQRQRPPYSSQPHQAMPKNNNQKRYIGINLNRLRDSYNSSPNVANPKDERGNHTTCRKCHSIYHWMQDCPHVNNEDNQPQANVFYGKDPTEEVYISLFQNTIPSSKDEVLCLVGETLNMAVIDSGCPTTVCGDKWLQNYLNSIPDEDRADLKVESGKSVFRFGDSRPMTSLRKVYLPVTIAEKKMYLPTDVVEADIPLLLSRQTLEKGKAIINTGNKTFKIYSSEQPMICTSSGHYAIPIVPHKEEINTNIIMQVSKTKENDKSVAKKLHLQFGHPSSERLIKLVKNSGDNNETLIDEIKQISANCDICKRYRKNMPRPIVTFPLASVFNETVAMDLKIYKNNSIYFMHVIDHVTRFSAAAVIRSKKAEVIVRNFFQIWVSVFGCPNTVLSDNGGEFVNEEFNEMCQSLNI